LRTSGQPHIIARSFVNQLAKGPAIKAGDAAALVRLAHQLEECSTVLQYLNYFADLNNFDNIKRIIVPFDLRKGWLRVSASIER